MSELWQAKHNVMRAVLDIVANEYSNDESSSSSSHRDYLLDEFDRALEEYSKVLFVQREVNLMKEKLEKIEKSCAPPLVFAIGSKREPCIQYVLYLDPRMPA